jgi:hypothetical protein
MPQIHVVATGDTLAKIARQYGTTVEDLVKLNAISNPNQIRIGQRLVLSRNEALGLQALFLDRERNPIYGLQYKIQCNGRETAGTTDVGGLTLQHLSDTVADEFRIFARRVDGSYKEIARVLSESGKKLVTLVSPSIRVTAEAQPHPRASDATPLSRNDKAAPGTPAERRRVPTSGKQPGVAAQPSKTADGKPITVVRGDVPDWSFLGDYTGEQLTKSDIEAAAKDLQCEAGLIHAIARQESAHSSFVVVGDRTVPTILYERHHFRKLTRPRRNEPSPFEATHPDICGPAYHLTKVNKRIVVKDGKKFVVREVLDKVTSLPAIEDDVYGAGGAHQYKRLVKAYQLDKSAALQSCSWGKFQIMGFNYSSAGYASVFDFVRAMSTGEAAHMKAFLKFAKANSVLLKGLRSKDFEKIAEGHNGAEWRSINPNYASNIERYYKEYSQ